MELISTQLTNEMKSTPYSTIVSRSQRWFYDSYLTGNNDSLPEKKNDIFLIPGKIYTFGYNPITPEEKLLARVPAFSFRPINLIIGQKFTKSGEFNPFGINLTFVPPKVRIMILDQIIRVFNADIIKPSIEQIQKGGQPTRTLPINWEMMQKMLEDSGFEYCIRSYKYDAFTSPPQIISYEDWWKICTFTIPFIKTANLMGIRSVYLKYYENMTGVKKIPKELKIAERTIKEVKSYKGVY